MGSCALSRSDTIATFLTAKEEQSFIDSSELQDSKEESGDIADYDVKYLSIDDVANSSSATGSSSGPDVLSPFRPPQSATPMTQMSWSPELHRHHSETPQVEDNDADHAA